MSASPTTSATTLRLFIEALDRLGVDSEAVLHACEIDPAALQDPEARIPQARVDRVWVEARKSSGDPCIGLHAGEQVHPHAVNLFGYLILSSATIGDGIRRVARFQEVLTDRPWIGARDTGTGLRVRVGAEQGDPDGRAVHAEYIATLVPQVLGWVSETKVRPAGASFSHDAQASPEEYERVLGCPVEFCAERNELVLGSDVLERASIHANARVAKLHVDFARDLLAQSDHASHAARVRRALAEELESGPPDLSSVARKLAMSPRNLQRKLADERTTFRELLDTLRRELARHHLERAHIPISEVAYLTGFSEASAFTRAVRRWFGRSPAQLRRGR